MSKIRPARESSSEDKEYGMPGFENEIQDFENADRKEFPPPGAIVCLGSSSFTGWNSTIQKDLAPLTIIPRGFGGSTMNDALHYTDRIVIPYKPRAVTFEDVVFHLSRGGLLDTIEHPNQQQYPGQRIFIVNVEGYACLVPFVEDDEVIFLKTIIPSRKMTKQYLGDD